MSKTKNKQDFNKMRESKDLANSPSKTKNSNKSSTMVNTDAKTKT
jgi:hypothetical protein